jgi:hypothetical protein
MSETRNEIVNINGKPFVDKEQLTVAQDVHEPVDVADIRIKENLRILKKNAETNDGLSFEQLYLEQQSAIIKELGSIEIVAAKYPQYTQIHSALHMHQRKNRPILPTEIENIVNENEWAPTENKWRLLLCHLKEQGEQMIIFCSDTCLKTLADSSRWHADGTFKSAVSGFHLVYISYTE